MTQDNNIFKTLKEDAVSGTTFFFIFYGIIWLIKKIVLLPFNILAWATSPKNKPAPGTVPSERDNLIVEFERLTEGLPAGDKLKYKMAAEKDPELIPRFLTAIKQIENK